MQIPQWATKCIQCLKQIRLNTLLLNQMPTSAEVVNADYDPKTDISISVVSQSARFAAGGQTLNPVSHDVNGLPKSTQEPR